MAVVDFLLKIEGIDGETKIDKHSGEIDVESFSWGENQTGTSGSGGGAGAGKVSKQDFSFVKKVDKSSPLLMVSCATGKHIKTAVLTVRKAGETPQEYLKITMTDLLVSSYQTGGAANSDVVPHDQVTLNFGTLEFSYKEQRADGSLGGEIKQKYDFAAGKKV